MGHARLPVRCRPIVAIIATGDELVPPGEMPTPDQIFAASSPGLAAYVNALGGEPRDFGIVRDDRAAITRAVERALALPADVVLTIGGALVGDHDLVQEALNEAGLTLDFWRVAMRPGKPLMFGRIEGTRVLGLPGNPVSSLVCAILFLRPLIAALLGQKPHDPTESATLGGDLPRTTIVRITSARAWRPASASCRRHPPARSGFLDAGRLRHCRLPDRAPAARAGGQGRRALPDHPPALAEIRHPLLERLRVVGVSFQTLAEFGPVRHLVGIGCAAILSLYGLPFDLAEGAWIDAKRFQFLAQKSGEFRIRSRDFITVAQCGERPARLRDRAVTFVKPIPQPPHATDELLDVPARLNVRRVDVAHLPHLPCLDGRDVDVDRATPNEKEADVGPRHHLLAMLWIRDVSVEQLEDEHVLLQLGKEPVDHDVRFASQPADQPPVIDRANIGNPGKIP